MRTGCCGLDCEVCDAYLATEADDDSMRRGACTERDMTRLACRRVEAAQFTRRLRGVPDGPVRGGRDIMRMASCRNRIFLNCRRIGSRIAGDRHFDSRFVCRRLFNDWWIVLFG